MRELRGWLLQRLKAPPKSEKEGLIDKVFAFGGGGSGLTDEAWKLVHQMWSFDYMGAAEYEFGAVPKTLSAMVKDQKKLIAYKIEVKGSDIKRNSWRKKGDTSKPKDTTVYAISREEDRPEVVRIMKGIADDTHQCKEYVGFIQAVDPSDDYGRDTRGWLDLSDPGGFFLFIDEPMWNKTCSMFDVKVVE